MLNTLKFLLVLITTSLLSFILVGSLFFFAGSRIIPLTGPVGGSFQLGYLAGLVWLFFIGGLVGLVLGIIVSIKIWERIK
jgi:hypothetical protein